MLSLKKLFPKGASPKITSVSQRRKAVFAIHHGAIKKKLPENMMSEVHVEEDNFVEIRAFNSRFLRRGANVTAKRMWNKNTKLRSGVEVTYIWENKRTTFWITYDKDGKYVSTEFKKGKTDEMQRV